MKPTTTSIAIVAVFAAFSASSLMAEEALPIRDCTWCHGSSVQGFANAPRLAGQRHQYLDQSLLSFKDHVRNDPYSKKYMWGAAANLSKEMARSFALYFSQLPAEPASDGDWALVNEGEATYIEGIPEIERRVVHRLSWPEGRGVRRHSAAWGHELRLFEKATRTVERRLRRHRSAHAPDRETSI